MKQQPVKIYNSHILTPHKLIKNATDSNKPFNRIKDRIGKAMQLARRNTFSLVLMNETNELEVYPAQVLLLLEKYDNASSTRVILIAAWCYWSTHMPYVINACLFRLL